MESSVILDELLTMAASPTIRLFPEQYAALRRMAACRTIEMGGHVSYCPHCGSHVIFYNPCNHRGCPICYEKNQIQWKHKLQKKLLPTGHFHLIFSVPDPLQYVWLGERCDVENTFFHCVQAAFKALQHETGLLFGIIMVFQSHGRGLCYKPHIHCIVTAGGVDDRNQWVPFHSFPYNQLRDTVKDMFLPHLLKKLPLHKRNAVQQMFSICKDHDWRVHPVFHKHSGNAIVTYLSHSIAGVVIDLKQDFTIDTEKNTITFTERRLGNDIQTTLSRETFTERYLTHIPPKGAVTIRNYGLYSNRHSHDLQRVKAEMTSSDDPGEASPEESNEEPEYSERCPTCQSELIIKEVFAPGEYPRCFPAIECMCRRAPPEHGSLLLAG
jgi:hypothetical protein